MNIRYFFISRAITSGLSLAIQQSDCIANQQPSPIVAPYTVKKTNLQFLKPVKSSSDSLNIQKITHKVLSDTIQENSSGKEVGRIFMA
ncbi:hypothetical protein [Bartonella tribocorum]|uniref:hypothetical protein n=1 Tax=Bartonella tribocorum TaxID=85701 RepID=UPI001FD9E700|nr:hypothetical protein [Bartonella tribocorum]